MKRSYSKNGKTVIVSERYYGDKRIIRLSYWYDNEPPVNGSIYPVSNCTTERGAMIQINKFLNNKFK